MRETRLDNHRQNKCPVGKEKVGGRSSQSRNLKPQKSEQDNEIRRRYEEIDKLEKQIKGAKRRINELHEEIRGLRRQETETTQQRKQRQKNNAAYVKRFEQKYKPNPNNSNHGNSLRNKRYWWNEE